MEFGLDPRRTTLLVFGGSQGARRLNSVLSVTVPDLLTAGIQVLHAVGPKNADVAVDDSDSGRYIALPYIERMDLATRSPISRCVERAPRPVPS